MKNNTSSSSSIILHLSSSPSSLSPLSSLSAANVTSHPLLLLDSASISAVSSSFSSNSSTSSSSSSSWYKSHHLLLYAVQVAIISVGILANLANVIVFWRAGLKDSVTVSFFSLSVSDLLHLVCFLVLRLLTIVQYEMGVTSSELRLQDLAGWVSWWAVYFMDVSMYITVYTAFQKCCCVVFPLTFTHIFTRGRSVAVVAAIFVATLAIFVPVFVHILNKWFWDETTKDKPLNWVALNTSLEATVWRWMHRIVFTITSQVIVILSLAVLTAKLKKSLKFRLSTKSENLNHDLDGAAKTKNTTTDQQEGPKLDQKELRAIRAVQLIAFIFIVATLPASLNSVVTILYPQINQPRYRDVVFTVLSVIYFGGTINASVNVLVYLKYNTRYRTIFVDTFLRRVMAGAGRKTPPPSSQSGSG